MSVKNHPTTETKKPKLHGECWNSFVFLVFWFFGFFGFLVVWFYCGEGYISKKPPKNQKTKKPKLFQHSPWSFGFLVFWFRSSGGSSRTRSEGSNSIPLKKHEHAGGSDVLKGAVCHGGGGDHIYIYIYGWYVYILYIYIYRYTDIQLHRYIYIYTHNTHQCSLVFLIRVDG